ncbi:MAG: D-glycerate dehydrogenase [Pseudomonadota bacterium]
MPRVLVTRPLPKTVMQTVAAHFEMVARDSVRPMDRDEMIAALKEFDGVLPTLGDLFSDEIFSVVNAPRVRVMANFGVGYNHIDVTAAKAAGITVTNTPGAVTDATADIAMTLILMTARRAGEGERFVRAGAWTGWHPTQMLGLHVTGKTVGIIGMGRIGKAVARRCQAGFAMEVVFHNRSRVSDFGVPASQLGSAEEVAARSDVIVVAVPGGRATRHLVGADIFHRMKRDAIFINIARGDVVDEAALVAALQDGRIAGAGLDVYESEPHVPEALIGMENVVLLPHLGTAALEVREAMGMRAVGNLRAFFEGRTPPDLI